jgi:hypothetical protein
MRREISVVGTLALGALALAGCEKKPVPPSDMERAEAFYATLPQFQQPLAMNQTTPAGLPDLRAETCGACHTEIYNEWKISTHARAWEDDAQFMEELHKSRTNNGDVGWMCINCHTPVANQQPELVVGLKDGKLNSPIYVKNPAFDAKMQLEAITCATCHVRDGVILGPRGDATHSPHPVRRHDPLVTEATCTRCHEAQAVFPDINLGCFFGTGTEFASTAAARQGDTCQTCHMPVVERPIAIQTGLPVRKTRRHWFGGSLIPKKPEYAAELEPLKKVFGSGVEISVNPAGGECATEDPCMFATVAVANSRAGHHMPTGDPERHVVVDVVVKDGDTTLMTRKLEYGSKYSWWPKIELKSDNRIPAGQHDSIKLELPDRPITVEIVAWKYRMYEDAFKHHKLEGRYVRGREFHRSTWEVTKDRVERLQLVDDLHPIGAE